MNEIDAVARTIVNIAGEAGGLDEVRRIAERGWPTNVAIDMGEGVDIAEDELRAAVQARAIEMVRESGRKWRVFAADDPDRPLPGEPSEGLVEASYAASAGPAGMVHAWRDASGVWQHCSEDEADRYSAIVVWVE